MKLLIDQNLSHRLEMLISQGDVKAIHVKTLHLMNEHDHALFMYARENSFEAIVTQDEDFYHLSLQYGIPPKIIWFRIGNCRTSYLSEVWQRNLIRIQTFLQDPEWDTLELYG